MKNYEEMSDPEINKLVTEQGAWTEPGCTAVTFENHWFWANATGFYAYPIEDYCNDVSVAWPIIIENKISMAFNWEVAGLWTAFVARQHYESTEENPLRAAMICFLKMKDAKVSEWAMK